MVPIALVLISTLAAEANPQAAPPAPAAAAVQPEPAPASGASSSAAVYISAGLKAYQRRRFALAEAEFRKALDADPKSAAAAYYLGYAIYKLAEPKRPFHPDKQKAAEYFTQAFSLDPTFKPDWGRR